MPEPSEDMERSELAATLGLPPDFSDAQLRRTYRSLARTHHPDNGGDPDFMRTINAAYERLLELPSSRPIDDFLGEPDQGWNWADAKTVEPATGFGPAARTVLAFVVLPILALTALAVAVWFIAGIG